MQVNGLENRTQKFVLLPQKGLMLFKTCCIRKALDANIANFVYFIKHGENG